MKIELLTQRENALDIISNTLIRYWGDRYKLNVVKAGKADGNLKLVINAKLNFIAFSDTDSKEFGVIKKEFGLSTNLLKIPIQWIYVSLACSKLFRSLFAKYTLFFKSSKNFGFEKNLIIGGNHRIRINAKQKGISTVILKEGFNKNWMKNEIVFRNEHQHLEALKLVDFDKDYCWYDEHFFEGIPCNRIANVQKRTEVENSALSYLKEKIATPKLAKESARKYRTAYLSDLVARVEEINNYEKEVKEELCRIIKLLENTFSRIETNDTIYLTNTHGDFQPANVLEKNGTIRIIDWEEVALRSCYYDLIVWLTNSRNEEDFEPSLTRIFKNPIQLENWLPTNIEGWKETCFLCYCMEEINYHFNDHCNPMFYTSGKGLSPILKNITNFLKNNY